MELYLDIRNAQIGSGYDGYMFDSIPQNDYMKYYINDTSSKIYTSAELNNYANNIPGDNDTIIELLKNIKDVDIASTLEDSYKYYDNPLILSYIRALPEIKYNSKYHTYTDTCPISLDTFKEGDIIKMMPCTHYFLPEEIYNWMKISSTCPICKYDIKTMFT